MVSLGHATNSLISPWSGVRLSPSPPRVQIDHRTQLATLRMAPVPGQAQRRQRGSLPGDLSALCLLLHVRWLAGLAELTDPSLRILLLWSLCIRVGRLPTTGRRVHRVLRRGVLVPSARLVAGLVWHSSILSSMLSMDAYSPSHPPCQPHPHRARWRSRVRNEPPGHAAQGAPGARRSAISSF